MMKKMRNNQVQSGVIVQQMKQRWSCYNQSPSGRLLGVEPDYLLYSKVSPNWTPVQNGTATPPVKYFLQGASRGVTVTFREPPLAGGFGGSAPEAKNKRKIAL